MLWAAAVCHANFVRTTAWKVEEYTTMIVQLTGTLGPLHLSRCSTLMALGMSWVFQFNSRCASTSGRGVTVLTRKW